MTHLPTIWTTPTTRLVLLDAPEPDARPGIEAWQPPVLDDDLLDGLAAAYALRPERHVMPWWAWLAARGVGEVRP